MAKNGMEKNPFGKISSLHLVAAPQDEGTILRDVSFTAPYKMMRPFPCRDGGIRVMLLAASAGIMEGDRQEFDFHVSRGRSWSLFPSPMTRFTGWRRAVPGERPG